MQPSPRQILLIHNAGIWQGTFVRLDAVGRELERFASHLEVADRAGIIHADLTNGSSGAVRSMQFAEPPAEMQISPEGHWSLGPDRIGPWPWVCELCLVWGQQRRRVVVRHQTSGLESLVLVAEGRPGSEPEPPPSPLQAHATPQGADRNRWSLEQDAAVWVTTMAHRSTGKPEAVVLSWQPQAGLNLQIERRYSEHGLLVGLAA
jgi:hypothetical protein